MDDGRHWLFSDSTEKWVTRETCTIRRKADLNECQSGVIAFSCTIWLWLKLPYLKVYRRVRSNECTSSGNEPDRKEIHVGIVAGHRYWSIETADEYQGLWITIFSRSGRKCLHKLTLTHLNLYLKEHSARDCIGWAYGAEYHARGVSS